MDDVSCSSRDRNGLDQTYIEQEKEKKRQVTLIHSIFGIFLRGDI